MQLTDLFENSRAALQRWFAGSKVVDRSGEPLIVYHGTNQAVDRFKTSRRGLSTAHPTAHQAFWFTDNPAVAADYAQGAGERVRADIDEFEQRSQELQRRAARWEAIAQRSGRREDWDKATAAMEEWEKLEIDSLRADPLIGQNIMPTYLRMLNPLVFDAENRSFINIGGYHTMSDAIEGARRNKHDGLIIHNLVDSAKPIPATHYAVFRPRQIRSAFS